MRAAAAMFSSWHCKVGCFVGVLAGEAVGGEESVGVIVCVWVCLVQGTPNWWFLFWFRFKSHQSKETDTHFMKTFVYSLCLSWLLGCNVQK